MMAISLWLVALALLNVGYVYCSDSRRLYNDLFQRTTAHDARNRPVGNDSDVINVSIAFHLLVNYSLHGIVISSRTLKRLTKRGHLYRRKHQSDILDVALFILEECKGSGQLNGYRWMHSKCIESGFVVSQDTVRLLQGILDQRGVDNRRKRRLRRRKYVCSGPNAIWHIDGYDKLKPFGICIHGAIDGFSRHMIWIQAWNTNNNPRVVAGYFVQAAMLKNGVPERIRSDCGTENGHIEKMQVLLRTGHTDRFAGEQSFMYGASTLNQRIEWCWGLLRREAIQFWMELFKSLQNDGYFTGDFLDKALVQFCFMDMIQENIDSVARIWNNHLIRTSKHSGLPSGRPFILYTVPELYSTSDHLVHVDQDLLEACAHECIKKEGPPCDYDVFELCKLIMTEKQWELPCHQEEMRDFYVTLREELRQQL